MSRVLSHKPCPFCGGHMWRAYRIVAGNAREANEELEFQTFLRVDGFKPPSSEAEIWDLYHIDECVQCGAFAT